MSACGLNENLAAARGRLLAQVADDVVGRRDPLRSRIGGSASPAAAIATRLMPSAKSPMAGRCRRLRVRGGDLGVCRPAAPGLGGSRASPTTRDRAGRDARPATPFTKPTKSSQGRFAGSSCDGSNVVVGARSAVSAGGRARPHPARRTARTDVTRRGGTTATARRYDAVSVRRQAAEASQVLSRPGYGTRRAARAADRPT